MISVSEGSYKGFKQGGSKEVLRSLTRQKHARSESSAPFSCSLTQTNADCGLGLHSLQRFSGMFSGVALDQANGPRGFGSQTAADPRRAPEKQTVGTVTESHKMLTLQALSSSLMHCKGGGAWAAERLLGALRQSVRQSGRVHLHIIELQVFFEVFFFLKFHLIFEISDVQNSNLAVRPFCLPGKH